MSGAQETYLARLGTLGIDVTKISLDHKGTLNATMPGQSAPRPTERLPRLIVGKSAASSAADLELEQTLGKGGMGVVWSANQVALRRRVAVKQLHDDRVGPQAEAQLLREALVTGALEHPNIVPVHALGRDDDGRPVLVMKRIEGRPWSELFEPLYTDKGAASSREVEHQLGILMQVCQALEFAHAQGIVHRDIKPDNVMVGAFGEVYLLDWGIAVSTRKGDTALPSIEPGKLAGTPGYMAPEMAAADVENIDQRTDVYLLGATLHELITGQVRHRADGVFATLTLAFESPPIAYPEWVPAELAEICNRATHRDPTRRFASAKHLRSALADFLRHGSSRQLAEDGRERLEYLDGLVGGDLRLVTADAIQVHALASEGRFAFERALHEWEGNRDARDGLQRLLELMIRYELSNGNLRSATGLLGELPWPRPELEQQLQQATEAQAKRRREIALLEQARFESDIDVFKGARRRLSFLHGAALALLALILFGLRMLGLHEPGYPDAIVVCLVLSGVVYLGRRQAMSRHRANKVNRRLFDSILVAIMFVAVLFALGLWGDVPFPIGLGMGMVVAGATCAIMVVFFDRRLMWTSLGFVLTGVAIVAMPALRGLWLAIGGFASFAVSAIVWREVEQGRHATQRRPLPADQSQAKAPVASPK